MISYLKAFLTASILVLIFSIILLSLVPPVSRDALVHHLAVPKLYLQHGGIYEIPSMIFSYYPMNLDLLYMIPLYFGNDILPKFIHFGFALLTAWLIFDYLKRRLDSIYALLGAIFFLSLPIIIKLSITVYVDLGLIFFSTASLLLLLKWLGSGFNLKFLIGSGIFCGLAMGTKYNGLVAFFILTLFVPFIYSRYAQGDKPGFLKGFGQGLIFLLIALSVFSPWMIRNYHWKNNPIYPLYNNFFNPPPVVSSQNIIPSDSVDKKGDEKKSGSGIFTYRSVIYNETWWQMALVPLRIFFQGEDGNFAHFDGKLNPFLLLLPIFAFYRIKEESQYLRNEKKILLAFAVLFFLFAFFSTVMRIRYISPFIPPLVILSVFGTKNIIEIIKKFRTHTARKIGFTLLALMLTFFIVLNAAYVADQFRYVDPFPYLKSALSRDEYISKYRFEYPAMQYINNNLPPDALVLFIFIGKRGYHCNREYIPDSVDHLTNFIQLVKSSDNPQKIWLGLKKKGITHLLVQIVFLKQWDDDLFTVEEQKLLQSFFDDCLTPLYSKNGVTVFALQEKAI